MIRENKQLTYDSIYISIFFILLFINTLDRVQMKELHYVGEISIGLSLFAMFFMLLKTWIIQTAYTVPIGRVYFSLTVLLLVFTLSFIMSDYMDAYDYVHLLFFVIFILGSIRMYWNDRHIKIASYLFGLITVVFFIDWMQSGFIFISYKSMYGNENYLAVFFFALFFFHILAVKNSRNIERVIFLLVLAMNALLIVVTSARSVLIGIAIVFIAWVILKKSRHIFEKLIYVVFICNFLFVGVYVGLKDTWLGNILNEISVTIFNKNLFSGRPEIWQAVVSAVMKKPFFGYGLGVKAYEVAETKLTAHNMYLQLLLEFGFVGLIAFLLVLLTIWTLLMKRLDCFTSKLSACFMLGILVYNNFELTLLQNNYSIAFFQWIIMTIGISFTSRNYEE